MKLIYTMVLLSAALGMASCKQKKADIPTAIVPNVRIVHPFSGPITDTIAAAGSITTIEQSDLSFKTGGNVEEVLVKEGDFVRKGQLLARLNTSEYRAEIEQANLKIAQFRRDLNRLEMLIRDTLTTQEQLQNMETSLATAQAQKDALVYNFNQASIFAPEDGVILKKQVSKGEYKSSGALAFTLGSNDQDKRWVFKISVSDKDRLKLKLNDQTDITLDALPAKHFKGTVYRLESVPDPATLTYDCFIYFDPENENVVYGLTGKISLPVESNSAYSTLPLEAVTGISGGYGIIYTVSDDSVVNRNKVRLSSVTRNMAILASALPSSTRVIVAGNDLVEQGQKVHIDKTSL